MLGQISEPSPSQFLPVWQSRILILLQHLPPSVLTFPLSRLARLFSSGIAGLPHNTDIR